MLRERERERKTYETRAPVFLIDKLIHRRKVLLSIETLQPTLSRLKIASIYYLTTPKRNRKK